MSNNDLTQTEADALISMEKKKINNDKYIFPDMGGRLNIPLKSIDETENFFLDVSRGHIELKRCSFQNRARQVIILVRLCCSTSHRNPDNTVIPAPHIHIYKEGYGDKWATQVPQDFTDSTNLRKTLKEFMTYCNIIDKPTVSKGLF